ncbi:DUF2922 family protein [Clostridium scatologenes]|uniref:DUF2922 family protein n=1 Tax=Clostridium scatologenes TaxID=1548 RepID=UPI0009E43917
MKFIKLYKVFICIYRVYATVIIAKNIFFSSGGDLKSINSAHIIDRNSTSLSVK